MKTRIAWILLFCIIAGSHSGCSAPNPPSEDHEELIVFAAASLTETLAILGDSYMADHPHIRIIFNFDSSGTLSTQIQEGADCDIFVSAGQSQMDQLDSGFSANSLNYILQGSRFNILQNQVALVVPNENPATIHSFEELMDCLQSREIMLAVGNSDVPVGQYTQKILEYFGLDEAELAASGCLTYGSNVKEVATQVSEATVDCGIIYQTDAFSADLTVVDTATAEMCGQIIYPAAVLKTARNPAAAQLFLEYLTSDAADEVFSAVGFTPIA